MSEFIEDTQMRARSAYYILLKYQDIKNSEETSSVPSCNVIVVGGGVLNIMLFDSALGAILVSNTIFGAGVFGTIVVDSVEFGIMVFDATGYDTIGYDIMAFDAFMHFFT